ncbi:MAG TPA: DUF397 domain-containing protein [Streptosporangiaceae bacterium]|jgi:hypothetical protein
MDSTGASQHVNPEDLNLEDSTIVVAFVEGSKEGSDRVVTMRDASNPDGPTLVFTPAEWEAFVAGVRDGEFDLDEDGQLVELPERPEDPA